MDTITVDGIKFAVDIEHDADMGEPWKEHDGHGEVSKWTTRDKRPGERVLCEDRGSKRYYDFAETVKIAKRDGWGPGKPHEAAEADYQRLRAWCNDEWHYVGVVVTLCDVHGDKIDQYNAAVWGMESDDDKGIASTAGELAEGIIYDIGNADAVTIAVRAA